MVARLTHRLRVPACLVGMAEMEALDLEPAAAARALPAVLRAWAAGAETAKS